MLLKFSILCFMTTYHESVLLNEAIDGLNIKPDGIYVDVTFGGGGHTKAILQHLKHGQVIAFDQDQDAQQNIIEDKRFTLIPQNFAHLSRYLRLYGISKVDGILADLGVSWHQFNTPNRGFSIRFDENDLDMRMNQVATITAQTILNSYPVDQLTTILKNYGELTNARQVAQKIVTIRQLSPIQKVAQLKTIIEPFIYGNRTKYHARLFQALRMEVNDELGVLKQLLTQSASLLNPNGRLVVIAYHSIEDRVVKNYFKKGSFDGKEQKDLFGNSEKPLSPINKKVIVPTTEEIKRNPKSRSAKMRIAEKR